VYGVYPLALPLGGVAAIILRAVDGVGTLVKSSAAENGPTKGEAEDTGDEVTQDAEVLDWETCKGEFGWGADHHRTADNDSSDDNRECQTVAGTVKFLNQSVNVLVPHVEVPVT
jgi:hypothetical protein